MRILLAEDAPRLSKQIVKGLTREGHQVANVATGEDALSFAQLTTYDAIILDVMLPSISGIEVLRRLRQSEVKTPILMLTALDSMDDIVRGLDEGADDYLTKPFVFTELCARLRAVSRRGAIPQAAQLRVHDLVLNPSSREVSRNGRDIRLTKLEFVLLEAMMRRAGTVFSRTELVQIGWSEQSEVSTNSLDVVIHHLRKKLTLDDEPEVLMTVRGIGYAMRRNPSE